MWKAADKLRSNMDAAEYKHVVLDLIFLKYISDAFIEVHESLKKKSDSDPEDRDEYISRRIFWVPKKARWNHLSDNAKKPEIGEMIDSAMDSIERENASLQGVLQKNYARPSLNKQRLGELIDLIGTIGLGDKKSKSQDVLGRVYEYFLGQFADAEGKKGGQFYTPRSIVQLLVEILEPYKGRIFDPCCGSGGMFVQSEKFIKAHGGRIRNISIYGQESNPTTWRLCRMNLAIRGIESNMIKWNGQGSFVKDEHKDLRANFILANPPFNDSDWSGDQLQDDVRWKYGVPPTGNANFAWIQHFIHHLSPSGTAGFVMSNGSMSSDMSNEGEIRQKIVERDLVECVVALPTQLFYNTQIPSCLWFVSKDKKNHQFRDRQKQVLFIDARNMGMMRDRRHRDLTDDDIAKITNTYHSWRSKKSKYKDVVEFCKSVQISDIEKHGWVLTPGRYVGFKEDDENTDVFEEKMKKLTAELTTQFQEGKKLEREIKKNLTKIGFKI
ncbi:MAG: class I SAM-dependent DNA methyltransferase [Thaumarchaeota archaeon]|nr:class I SAM-dependent DNA methyltransferase [Nitrososphaerota archaeon]